MDEKLSEDAIRSCLITIIKDFSNIEIENEDLSLFGSTYRLNAEIFVYFLLDASKKLQFNIDDDFINSLTNYSLRDLINSIEMSKHSYMTNSG